MISREDLIKKCMALQSQLSERDLQTNGLTTLTEEALERISVQKLVAHSKKLEEVIDHKKPKTITVKPEYKEVLDNLDVGSLLRTSDEKKNDKGPSL